MTLRKKILLILLIAVSVIQFIQPSRNKSSKLEATDLTKVFSVSQDVQMILKKSCYDCHSNNTNYPWYSRVQPFGWMLAKHIRNGKTELNFSELGSLSDRRQVTKLKGIANSIKDETMPLRSYTFLHRDAKLSIQEKLIIIDWANRKRDSLSASH